MSALLPVIVTGNMGTLAFRSLDPQALSGSLQKGERQFLDRRIPPELIRKEGCL